MNVNAQSDESAEVVTAELATRPNHTLTAIGFIALAGMVLFFLVNREIRKASPDKALAHPAVGAPLNDFEITVLTGDGENVASRDLKGKVSLITFWGPWCAPCLVEFPHLAKLAENLRGRDDFRWLPVAYSQTLDSSANDLRQYASGFLARAGLTNITYCDPDHSLLGAATVSGAFNDSFPCTVLVDKSGHVHAVWNGYREGVEKQVEAAVMELLE